nr:hypothetical protein [Quadrisphaera setariae]
MRPVLRSRDVVGRAAPRGGRSGAGRGPELEEITGFDEGPLGADWAEQFEARGVTVVTDVLREEALAVYREYRAEADGGRALV